MRRPIRDRLEDTTDKVPSGPLNKVGSGDLFGAAGYIAVESGEILTIPIPGATRPGFRYVSHSLVEAEDGTQRYEIVVHAVSKDIAEFAVKYKAAPSNIDFLRGDTRIVETELLDGDSTYSSYKVTVEIDRDELREAVRD